MDLINLISYIFKIIFVVILIIFIILVFTKFGSNVFLQENQPLLQQDPHKLDNNFINEISSINLLDKKITANIEEIDNLTKSINTLKQDIKEKDTVQYNMNNFLKDKINSIQEEIKVLKPLEN